MSICFSVSFVFASIFSSVSSSSSNWTISLIEAGAGAQIFADLQQLFQNQRSARDGFQDEQLPALDALGDGNFTFARQQRNSAHFAQVYANRIVRLFESSGRQVQFAIIRSRFFFCFNRFRRIGCRKRSLCGREVFIDVNPIALKR